MTGYKRLTLVAFAVLGIAVSTAGASLGDEPHRHVVSGHEIQARIDQQISQADADRQAVQIMLQREAVREIAGSAGLDIERAVAAAAILSGPALEKLAAQAREVDASLAGGDTKVVLSATGIIIVLLILILLLN